MTVAMATDRDGSAPIALLRFTLGVIILVTWVNNVADDLYTADGLKGFFSWLFAADGNASSLGFVESFLDTVVVPMAGPYGIAQLVVELLIGIGLVVGLFTRLTSLLAAGFFFALLLAYLGGHEWIWTYVLLLVSAVTVFLGYGGRRFGIDQVVYSRHGDSPAGNLLW